MVLKGLWPLSSNNEGMQRKGTLVSRWCHVHNNATLACLLLTADLSLGNKHSMALMRIVMRLIFLPSG